MRFTKTAALIMSLGIVAGSVAACSEPEPVSSDINIIASQDQGSSVVSTDEHFNPEAESQNYVFTRKGYNFIVGTVFDESALPEEPSEYFETASCAGEGMAMAYRFGTSFWVELYTESDVIAAIYLTDDTVATAEGISIGSTKDQVKEAYGDPLEETDYLIQYKKGSCLLQFEFNAEGTVEKIVYFDKQ